MQDAKSEKSTFVTDDNGEDLKPEIMDDVIATYDNKPGQLLLVLEELQKKNPYNYLSESVLKYVSQKLSIPIAKVYSVATFYSFFNLKPEGKHCVTICRGTACHTKRSRFLLEYLIKLLDIKEELNEKEKVFLTTEDRMFTVRTVACFGQCALAPVIEVDGVIHAHMNQEKMKKLVDQIKLKEEQEAATE